MCDSQSICHLWLSSLAFSPWWLNRVGRRKKLNPLPRFEFQLQPTTAKITIVCTVYFTIEYWYANMSNGSKWVWQWCQLQWVCMYIWTFTKSSKCSTMENSPGVAARKTQLESYCLIMRRHHGIMRWHHGIMHRHHDIMQRHNTPISWHHVPIPQGPVPHMKGAMGKMLTSPMSSLGMNRQK